MKVIFTFSDSSTYESSIIKQGFSCQEILFNRLQASDGFVGFSIPFSTTFSNKMTADINNNVLAVVYDENNNPYATGFVKKEVGYEQKYRNQPIKITIVSKSYMLDKTLNESYALESYTSAQIVTWLLTQAGISDIGSLSSMTTTVPLFVFNAGENIKDVLKEFCFEYSKTFYFDKNGYFQVADLFISSFIASQTFNRSNIRDRVNINVKEAEANCIRGRWTPLSLVSDTLVFEDKQNATSQYDCVIPIAANSWFGGVEDNFLKCDSTLGEVKYVKSITQNNIQSDSGITKTLDLLERTSLNQLHFTAQNTTASVKNITKMQVYANAYIAKENRGDVTTYGNKEKELSLKYIQDQTTAQNFVKALADYYNSTSFTVSFSSDVVCDIGDLVTVSADGIGSFNCRIIQRTRNIITDTIDYVCENIGDYTPAVIVQTVQEPLAVNIAGGKKGLDGAPGTPGADGKNAITMTSATTPSGEYNGQVGVWQGQIYTWNGSAWVCQEAPIPTDAVVHYSFDDVPDLPDGSADYRKNKDFIDTSGWIVPSDFSLSVSNNCLKISPNNSTRLYMLARETNVMSTSTLNGKEVKIKFRSSFVPTIVSFQEQQEYRQSRLTLNNKNGDEYIYSGVLSFSVTSSVYLVFEKGSTVTASDYILIEQIYIGNGSYNTPIIDNSGNGINATNNGALPVQGVSRKGAYFHSANQQVAVSYKQHNSNNDLSISLWIKIPSSYNYSGEGAVKAIFATGAYAGLFGFYRQGSEIGFISRDSTNVRQCAFTPDKDVWLSLVAIYSGSTHSFKLYVNGELKFTSASNLADYLFGDNTWYIWGNSGRGGSAVTLSAQPAYIDDVLIYERLLSEKEIRALYYNKADTPKYYTLTDYQVDGVDDDGVITPTEKEMLYQKWIDIYAVLNGTTITASSTGQGGEYGKMISRATTAGVSLVTTGGEGKAYVDATEALRAGLWTTAYLQNMSVQTKVSAGAIDTLFNNYRTAYEALSIAIDVQNKATASALSISQSNSYHQVPTNSSGTPLSYVGTDNTVYLLEGSSKLTCVATGTTLTAGKWKITNITMTGCTSGTTKDNYTISDNGAVLGVLTGMTEQSAKRTLTIQFMGNNASTAETITVVQSFAKSQAGADGSTYKLLASANCVKTNTSVRFDAKKIVGESVSSYADGYLYSSTDGTTWTAKGQFKNGSAYASKNISVSVDTIFRLCLTESPSTNIVDELSVNIFRDGVDGQDGHSPTVTATKSGTQTTIKVDDVTQAVINDGTNGTNGTNTWYSSASATSSTTSIALNTITSVTGHTVAVGDLIIANGLVFYISAVSSTNATVVYKEKIKGETGGTGNFTKRIPLYYVGNSATAPSAPSSRVTSTSTATTTTWTQGIYNTYAVGKYYYTCEQIEVYNNAGTYQSCTWSTVSRHTEYENACLAKLRSAGQYIGTKSAPFTNELSGLNYSGSDNWDWFFATANFTQQSVSIVAGNVYVWNGSTWSIDSDTSHLAGALNDMIALVDTYVTDATSVGAYARLFAKTLAVQQAFIDELMTNAITVNEYIQSSNYSQASETVSGAGYKLNKNGKISANELEVNGMNIQSKGVNNNNIAIGYAPMQRVTTGVANIGIGTNAGANITTGDNNIAIGMSALKKSGTTADTTGDDNVVIGNNAGKNITSGYGNIVLGTQAGDNITTAHDNIAIGNSSINKNKIVSIGNTISGTSNKIQDNAVLIGADLNVNSSSNLNKYVNINNVIQYINGTLKIDSKTSPTGGLTADVLASLKSVAYTANGNCLKLSDDFMIQWGKTDNLGSCSPGGTKTATITFGEGVLQTESFYNNNYAVIVSLEGSTSGMEMAVYDKSTNGFKIIGYSRNTNATISNVIFHWLAIGSA